MNQKILIVEDEGLIALDLKRKLEQSGYSVPMIADNGEDALKSVELFKPCLVLMDIHLRGARDGISTANEVRRKFHVPVVFVTAHADRETLDMAKITEPFGYIVKPFHSVDFRAQIEMALWKHKMEERLRTSEAWLAATFKNVADALIATDEEGRVASMNALACDLTGWDAREAKGLPLLEVFQVYDEVTGYPALNPLEAIYDGRDPEREARVFRLAHKLAEGDEPGWVVVEAEFSANRDDGNLLGIIVVFRDVTARRRAERRDRQLKKMTSLAEMAIGLARDLTESQNRMDYSLKVLINKTQGTARRLVGDVHKCSEYQQTVLQQLMTLGRADAGQAMAVDLNAFLLGMESDIQKHLGRRRTLRLDLCEGLPEIQVDPEDLRENLMRLVADAREASPDGGVVEISTLLRLFSDGRQTVQATIRDSGRAVRPSVEDRVFDPYYQARPGKANPGFSLALVYRFVALSGGGIDVESDPGRGNAYILNFPTAESLRASQGMTLRAGQEA